MSKLLPRQYAKILFELTKEVSKEKMDIVINEFVDFLRREQVVSKFEYIVAEFERYAKEQDGVEFLEITSSTELSKKQVSDIAKNFGEKHEISTKVEPSIVGGVIVKKGNIILDGSVKTQLEKMKREMV